MIVIETKLKVLPTKCNKCKYSYIVGSRTGSERVCEVTFKNGLHPMCPMEFNKEKNNWEYVKPNWCPLREVNI